MGFYTVPVTCAKKVFENEILDSMSPEHEINQKKPPKTMWYALIGCTGLGLVSTLAFTLLKEAMECLFMNVLRETSIRTQNSSSNKCPFVSGMSGHVNDN